MESNSFMQSVHIAQAWRRSRKNSWKRPEGSGARATACLLALLTGAALALTACSSPSSAPGSPPGGIEAGQSPLPTVAPTRLPAKKPAAPPGVSAYTVRSNVILGPDRKPFVPYGITIIGLAASKWQSSFAWDEEQIEAIARYWHGNTVRIQVAPPDLFDASPYNKQYLAAVEEAVATAQDFGLNVILSAQYERTTNQAMPNAVTARFWQLIAATYKADPGVWFDLFNEPALVPVPADNPQDWEIWQDGGHGFVGMQTLVDVVRATGARNVVLAEGLEKARTLAGLPGHWLTGGNVAYAVHPYFAGPYWSTPQAWEANWGDLTGTVPVVADEWGEFQTTGGSCVDKAPALVRYFLSYLSDRQVGLVAWSLLPGVLIRGNNLDDPTAFNPGVAWTCRPGNSGPRAQGAGQAVRDYFFTHSVPVSAIT
jgi:endoglucanase